MFWRRLEGGNPLLGSWITRALRPRGIRTGVSKEKKKQRINGRVTSLTPQDYTVVQHKPPRESSLPPFGAETKMDGLLKHGTPAGTATLTVGEKSVKLPVLKGSVGPDVI